MSECPDPSCLETNTVVQWPPEGALATRAMFPCYPGSGSKWVLTTLEESCGVGARNRSGYLIRFLNDFLIFFL